MGTVLVGFVCFVRYEKDEIICWFACAFYEFFADCSTKFLDSFKNIFPLCVMKAAFKWIPNDIFCFY